MLRWVVLLGVLAVAGAAPTLAPARNETYVYTREASIDDLPPGVQAIVYLFLSIFFIAAFLLIVQVASSGDPKDMFIAWMMMRELTRACSRIK